MGLTLEEDQGRAKTTPTGCCGRANTRAYTRAAIREADQDEHGVGVQLGGVVGIEAVARDVGVAGVPAGTGDHGAQVDRHPRDQVDRPQRHAR